MVVRNVLAASKRWEDQRGTIPCPTCGGIEHWHFSSLIEVTANGRQPAVMVVRCGQCRTEIDHLPAGTVISAA